MAHKILENNKETYILFNDKIDVEDFNDYNILKSLDSNKNVTIDISKADIVTCSDGLVGLYLIAKDMSNVALKGFNDEYKKSVDILLNL